MRFIFQGLYSPPDDENVRVEVQVTDLNYFLSNPSGKIFAAEIRDGERYGLGEIDRSLVVFDYCGPEER